jgi:hypothetical protein
MHATIVTCCKRPKFSRQAAANYGLAACAPQKIAAAANSRNRHKQIFVAPTQSTE